MTKALISDSKNESSACGGMVSTTYTRIQIQRPISPLRSPRVTASASRCSMCGLVLAPGGNSKSTCEHTNDSSSANGRLLCSICWMKTYSLCLCWACGEPVVREEEKVGYGWCWWHWGCLSCLLCKAPMPPPPWTDEAIDLQEPPICSYCESEDEKATGAIVTALREAGYEAEARESDTRVVDVLLDGSVEVLVPNTFFGSNLPDLHPKLTAQEPSAKQFKSGQEPLYVKARNRASWKEVDNAGSDLIEPQSPCPIRPLPGWIRRPVSGRYAAALSVFQHPENEQSYSGGGRGCSGNASLPSATSGSSLPRSEVGPVPAGFMSSTSRRPRLPPPTTSVRKGTADLGSRCSSAEGVHNHGSYEGPKVELQLEPHGQSGDSIAPGGDLLSTRLAPLNGKIPTVVTRSVEPAMTDAIRPPPAHSHCSICCQPFSSFLQASKHSPHKSTIGSEVKAENQETRDPESIRSDTSIAQALILTPMRTHAISQGSNVPSRVLPPSSPSNETEPALAHTDCLVCTTCLAPFQASAKTIDNWIFVEETSSTNSVPYHRACRSQQALTAVSPSASHKTMHAESTPEPSIATEYNLSKQHHPLKRRNPFSRTADRTFAQRMGTLRRRNPQPPTVDEGYEDGEAQWMPSVLRKGPPSDSPPEFGARMFARRPLPSPVEDWSLDDH